MRRLKLLALLVCRTLGLFWVARQITKKKLKIFGYHGFELLDETSFRPKLFIKPEQFALRLETIHRMGYRVFPLHEAIKRLYEDRLPEDVIVITVDDGFHSFYRLAMPRLRLYGYPATVYVTTYYVQHPNPVFRLAVQYMFWKTSVRCVHLKDIPWSAECVVDLSDTKQLERVVWDCINFGERACTEEQRQSLCQHLGKLLDVPYEKLVRSRSLSLMCADELCQLANWNIEVELHSHRHAFPANDQAVAKREIADNRAALGLWFSDEKRHFCYPSGIWDQGQWRWLDEMGIRSSMTCVPGLNDRNTPRHALRRFLDGENIHQLEFEAALSGFVGVLNRLRSGIWRV